MASGHSVEGGVGLIGRRVGVGVHGNRRRRPLTELKGDAEIACFHLRRRVGAGERRWSVLCHERRDGDTPNRSHLELVGWNLEWSLGTWALSTSVEEADVWTLKK
jgi:hypothetical protein